ncbi:MAG: matrixin family metalloprotease [Candidatus Obscuribacterales bacterium]|nr:matrixin family metalloprotease [Candidatus Obscuribacterales bacterium]
MAIAESLKYSRLLLLVFLSMGLFPFCAAWAQSKALPKANFGNYSTDNELPQAAGLHLAPGLNRKAGAPAEIYNPGEPSLGMKLVQWDRRRLPLKVWISMGKKLPEESFATLQASRPDEVYQMLVEPKSIWELPDCPGWTQDMNVAVANGIEQWREFENEGLISFGFVDRPEDANVLVFFVDHFVDADSPGGISVHANTSAKVFDANVIRQALAGGKMIPRYPVVIEMQVNPELYRLQADAAHEFGHALGIKAHSPYREDIMHENRQVDILSASDKATLRWLYRQRPTFLME